MLIITTLAFNAQMPMTAVHHVKYNSVHKGRILFALIAKMVCGFFLI